MAMYIILLSFLLVIAGIFYIFIECLPRNNVKKIVLKLARICIPFVFILGIVLIFVVAVLGGEPTPSKSAAYRMIKDEIQNAVTAYQTDHNELIPTLSSIYTNADCSACSVINISALLTAHGGTLRDAPDGLNLSASGNDNCGGNTSLGCVNGWHYIWIVDAEVNVFSYCAGAGCTTNNSDYQDVWP
jgi:hypothetical protein